MNEKFVASNGVEIVLNGEHWSVPRNETREPFEISTSALAALRQFFQHERDKELGRWRDPENQRYVVHPFSDTTDEVRVTDEETGYHFQVAREAALVAGSFNPGMPTARAYFTAHPEPKPWHDAREGEIWIITTDNVGDEVPVKATTNQKYGTSFRYIRGKGRIMVADSRITNARRLWPEGDAS